MVVRHLKQIGKVKEFNSVCLMSYLKIKKIVLKCCLLLFYTTATNHFLIGLWRATKSGFYMTTGNDQLSGWTKKKLQITYQSQTCAKERSWSPVGGLLLVWYTTAFWIPAKPLHLRSTLSKSMRCIENCNACSWHWSTKWAQFFFKTMPDCRACRTSNTSKVEQIGPQLLTHLPFSPNL